MEMISNPSQIPEIFVESLVFMNLHSMGKHCKGGDAGGYCGLEYPPK
jgi:hypothetical protein